MDEDGDEDEDAPAIDMNALQAFAGQLLGGPDGTGKPVTSFEVGKLFEDVQQQLLQALGVEDLRNQAPGEHGDVIDEEFAPPPDDDKEPRKK